MARKKIIENEELIALIDEYYYNRCFGNFRKMKPKLIADYIQKHGYPEYKEYLLRRNEEAIKHIADLKLKDDEELIALSSYKTIDAVRLVEDTPSKKKLIEKIVALDKQYEEISDAACNILKKNKGYEDEIERLNKELNEIQKENETLKRKNTELRDNEKELKDTIRKHKSAIDKYVYPEISNRILKEDFGINAGGTEHIKDEIETITADERIPLTKSLLMIFGDNKNEA